MRGEGAWVLGTALDSGSSGCDPLCSEEVGLIPDEARPQVMISDGPGAKDCNK